MAGAEIKHQVKKNAATADFWAKDPNERIVRGKPGMETERNIARDSLGECGDAEQCLSFLGYSCTKLMIKACNNAQVVEAARDIETLQIFDPVRYRDESQKLHEDYARVAGQPGSIGSRTGNLAQSRWGYEKRSPNITA